MLRPFLIALFVVAFTASLFAQEFSQTFTEAQWKAVYNEIVPAGKCWAVLPGGREGWTPCTKAERRWQESSVRKQIVQLWNEKHGVKLGEAKSIAAATQAPTVPDKLAKAMETPGSAPKVEDKKPAPDTFAVPETRRKDVKLLQQEVELAALRMKEIERLYNEQKDLQKVAADKWQAELLSAMKLAGVEEKDFQTYEYNRDTLTFTRKKEVAPEKKQ